MEKVPVRNRPFTGLNIIEGTVAKNPNSWLNTAPFNVPYQINRWSLPKSQNLFLMARKYRFNKSSPLYLLQILTQAHIFHSTSQTQQGNMSAHHGFNRYLQSRKPAEYRHQRVGGNYWKATCPLDNVQAKSTYDIVDPNLRFDWFGLWTWLHFQKGDKFKVVYEEKFNDGGGSGWRFDIKLPISNTRSEAISCDPYGAKNGEKRNEFLRSEGKFSLKKALLRIRLNTPESFLGQFEKIHPVKSDTRRT